MLGTRQDVIDIQLKSFRMMNSFYSHLSSMAVFISDSTFVHIVNPQPIPIKRLSAQNAKKKSSYPTFFFSEQGKLQLLNGNCLLDSFAHLGLLLNTYALQCLAILSTVKLEQTNLKLLKNK